MSEVHNITINVTVATKKAPKDFKDLEERCRTTMKESQFLTPGNNAPAYVEVKYGVTLNLKNYESCRIDVAVKMPCDADRIKECYDHVKKLVEDYVEAESKEVTNGLTKKA